MIRRRRRRRRWCAFLNTCMMVGLVCVDVHSARLARAELQDIQLVRFASPRIGASMRVLHRLLHTMLHTMLIGTRQTKRSED